MAFTDNGTRRIVEAALPVKITLAEGCVVGDLLGYSSGWKLADANNSIYAELIAGEKGATGDEITAFRSGVVDGFSGGSVGSSVYLSDTAGKYSDSAGTVSQVVGRMISTTSAFVQAQPLRVHVVRGQTFDLDAGAGTVDEVIFRPGVSVTLVAARVVYEDVQSGAVTGCSVALGTSAGGTQIAAATSLEASKDVGTITSITLANTSLNANTPLCARWTLVAAGPVGKAHLEVEYKINEPA